MLTFPLNKHAENFEVDRSTMVKAMRDVPPDLVKRGNRPTWKTATAAKALEAHRAKMNGVAAGNGEETGLSAERAKLAQAQTAAVLLKNAVASGEYVRLSFVQGQIELVFAVIRERLLTIPGKTANACEGRTRAEIEDIIRDEVCEALAELSDPTAQAA